jgi:cell division protein FtsW
MVSRAEPSLSGRWWWSIDRLILSALVALMVSGVVLLMAGGPPVSERLGLSTFHFVNRQAVYLLVALTVVIAVSFMTPRQVRRSALLLFVVSLAMVVATLYLGVEVKGARRWLTMGPLGSVQPSEFLKPAFVVLAAWAFA